MEQIDLASDVEPTRTPDHWDGCGLTITVTRADAVSASLRLAGELDGASAELLTSCLKDQLRNGRRYVRMDLSGLGFVDPIGLHAVEVAHDAFLNNRGTLIVLGLRGRSRRLVDLLHLDHVLLIAAESAATAAPFVQVRDT